MINGNENKVVDYLDGFQIEERDSRTPKKGRSHKTRNSEQYAGNVLQFFPTAEGYVNVIDESFTNFSSFNYVFNHTDHLGNIRLSYTKNPQTRVLEILDETHYYPFGLKHEVYIPALKQNFVLDQNTARGTLTNVTETDYQYKYNGKEWQDELGLNFYDYGARNYDAAIGRFFTMDKYSEAYYSMNPFQYTANNPVKFIDINGEYIWIWDEDDKKYKYDKGKLYSQNEETGEYDQEHTASEGSYVAQMQGFLDQIGCEDCENGKALLEFFNDNDVDFFMGDVNKHSGGIIYTNFEQKDKIFTTGKPESINTNFFVTIAHELGHAKSFLTPSFIKRRDKWYSTLKLDGKKIDITIDEVYAMYIENLIRSENNLNLRTHYDTNYGGQFLRGKKGKLTKEAKNILERYYSISIEFIKK